MYKYMSRDGMTYQFIGLNIFIPDFQYGWNCFNLGTWPSERRQRTANPVGETHT